MGAFGHALELAARRPPDPAGFAFAGTLPAGATLTRASAGGYVASDGAVASAAANVARFDHDPVSHAVRGLMIEPATTNVLRTSVLTGATVGSPAALPNYWGYFLTAGLTTAITGTGTEDGLSYIDVRCSGTPNGTTYFLVFDMTGIGVIPGETWCTSFYARQVGGTLSNVATMRTLCLGSTSATAQFIVSGASLARSRQQTSGVIPAGENKRFSSFGYEFFDTVTPVDITFRIAAPQLEKTAVATSFVPTNGAAATRAADAVTLDWGTKGVADGPINVRYGFDDGSTQAVATTVSGGTAGIPAPPGSLRLRSAHRI